MRHPEMAGTVFPAQISAVPGRAGQSHPPLPRTPKRTAPPWPIENKISYVNPCVHGRQPQSQIFSWKTKRGVHHLLRRRLCAVHGQTVPLFRLSGGLTLLPVVVPVPKCQSAIEMLAIWMRCPLLAFRRTNPPRCSTLPFAICASSYLPEPEASRCAGSKVSQ